MPLIYQRIPNVTECTVDFNEEYLIFRGNHKKTSVQLCMHRKRKCESGKISVEIRLRRQGSLCPAILLHGSFSWKIKRHALNGREACHVSGPEKHVRKYVENPRHCVRYLSVILMHRKIT